MSNNKCVYYKEKEQNSNDGGITWVDTGRFRKGALVTTQASQCGSYTNEYRWIKADYVCDNGNKYNGYKQQVSHDNGGSWVDTGVVNIGDLIEETSPDCVPPSMKVTYTDGTTKYFSNLTSIGEYTVSNKADAENVEIYDSVIEIGNFAFANCDSLTSISIPISVTSIGQYAFANCSSLTGITIPNSVTSIGIGAFYDCTGLKTMTVNATTPPTLGNGAIPTTISRIYVPADSVDAYKSADGWKDFADKIWAIGYDEQWFVLTGDNNFICDGASKYKKKELKYTRDSGTTWNSFDTPKYEKGDLIEETSTDCASMKVTYTDGTTKYFANLTSIKSDTIPNKENAKDAIIYNGVNSIGESAFNGCNKLESVTIPDSVTSIGKQAFLGCTSLTSIRLPKNLISIADKTFEWCSGLTSITVSDNLKSVGKRAFANCFSLTGSSLYSSVGNTTYDPPEFSLPVGDIDSIGEEAFVNCSSVTSIGIGDDSAITTIPNGAFEGCSNAKELYISNSVKSIGDNAFRNCSSLSSITFDNAGQLKTSSLASIGNNAFQNCSAVTSITIHDSVTNIGSNAFNGSSNLTTVTIENSTSKLAYNTDAFANISSSAILYVPSNLLSNYMADTGWANAFKGGIHAIGEFLSMKVTYVDGTEKEFYTSGTIDKNTDSNKANAKNIEIYNGVTRIEEDAFRNCTHITEITIPSSVGWIGKCAFLYCSNLKYVTIKAQTRLSYNAGAFSNIADGAELLVPPSVWSLYKNDGNWSIAFNGRIYGYSE